MGSNNNLPLPWFLASVAVRTVIVLFALLAGIRIFGKRHMGNMNLFDLVLVLMLGNAVQNALTFGSGNFGVGLVSAGVLLAIDRLMGSVFNLWPAAEARLYGEPVILASDGKYNLLAMKREKIDEDMMLAAMHNYGLLDISQVHLAVLEPDGTISIVPKEEKK